MKNNIIAENEDGEGLLLMKQSEELEAKKPIQQRLNEYCNFIKNAFIVDGKVQMVRSLPPTIKATKMILNDSRRGKFVVSVELIKEK